MDETTTLEASVPPVPGRRRRLRKPVLVAGGVVIGLLAPYVASAVTPTFPDVPVSHAFYDEIEWLNATGVTTGFGDGTYRPGQDVTRGNMAAFMQRLYDVQEDMSWYTYSAGAVNFSGTTWTDLPGTQVTVQVPDGVYANISARFSGETRCIGDPDSWCSVRLVMSKNGGPFVPMAPNVDTDFAFDSAATDYWEGHAMERLAYGDPGSSYTIKAQAAANSVEISYFGLDDWSLVAETDLQPSDYIPS